MAEKKTVYKNPKEGQPLLKAICTGCKTPQIEIKFSSLTKAYYYANSPKVPRYSVTCTVDPKVHKEFIEGIQSIEINEKVETVLKNETFVEDDVKCNSGYVLLKFQSKEKIPVYIQEKDKKPELMELEDELAKGEKVVVVYDILRYTKKNTMKIEHGLSFKPTAIYFYPKE